MTHGITSSFMSFERFIKDNLTIPIKDIFIEINKMIEDNLDINVSILYIDGNKFVANANKMTFVRKKKTQQYYIATYKNLIKRLNKYFKKQGMNV